MAQIPRGQGRLSHPRHVVDSPDHSMPQLRRGRRVDGVVDLAGGCVRHAAQHELLDLRRRGRGEASARAASSKRGGDVSQLGLLFSPEGTCLSSFSLLRVQVEACPHRSTYTRREPTISSSPSLRAPRSPFPCSNPPDLPRRAAQSTPCQIRVPLPPALTPDHSLQTKA